MTAGCARLSSNLEGDRQDNYWRRVGVYGVDWELCGVACSSQRQQHSSFWRSTRCRAINEMVDSAVRNDVRVNTTPCGRPAFGYADIFRKEYDTRALVAWRALWRAPSLLLAGETMVLARVNQISHSLLSESGKSGNRPTCHECFTLPSATGEQGEGYDGQS